jgi:hypothetical protein
MTLSNYRAVTTIPVSEMGAAGESESPLAGWDVEDLESEVGELVSKGITFEQYDFESMTTNEKGIADVGGVFTNQKEN